MSHRPIATKKANRLRKALRNTPDRYINLVEYMMDRRLAKSKRVARELLLAGKVRVGSHKVGRVEVNDPLAKDGKRWVLQPLIPASQRSEILILTDD